MITDIVIFILKIYSLKNVFYMWWFIERWD